MTHPTAMPHGDRREMEQAADVSVTPGQQICYWIVARKLEGCRGSTGFRIEERELADIIASPHSDRPRRQGRGDDSRPTFASA
jgi:hypothetical protein